MQYVSYHNYGSYLNVNNYYDTKKNHATIVKLIATLKRATKPQFSNLVLNILLLSVEDKLKIKWSSVILLQRFLIEVSVEVYCIVCIDQYFRIDLSYIIDNVS